MVIDVAVLCVVLFFALLGALSGAARQLGHLLALGAATLCARPLGGWLAPMLVGRAGALGPFGTASGAILGFLAAYLAVRILTTPLLRRALVGREEERAATDRWLGFVLGALKSGALLFVLFSAAIFMQENVTVGRHRLEMGLSRSITGALVHRFNLFGRTEEPRGTKPGGRARAAGEEVRRLAGDSELLRELEAAARP